MPYLGQSERDDISCELAGFTPHTGGELQYAIAYMINNFYNRLVSMDTPPRYADMEEMMGALDGAAREHYRMVVAPYEDKKIAENGGVYDVKGSESLY
jgi:hypothetical protein